MKNVFRLVSVLLVLVMLFSFVACAPNTGSQDTTNQSGNKEDPAVDSNKYADIAGEYLLDATDLGMPMKWYIKITADGKFAISTKRDFSDNKGEGTIGDKDGTYMLVYSDSTAENQKTATFKFEGKNMVFSTRVHIGAAGVNPSEDGTKFPTAVLIANEDLLGSYFGSYEKVSAMAGTVVYEFQLDLAYGSKYTFASSFAMGGSTYTRTETGTFDVNGTEISFTALAVDGEAVEAAEAVKGTIEDKTIKAAFKLSAMASAPQEIEAKFGTYTEYAGTYTAYYEKTMGMGQMAMTIQYLCELELDPFGGYVYVTVDPADPTVVDYSEEGTYTVTDGKFAFTSSAEGATAVEGTYANYVLATKLPISAMMSSPVDLSFYAEAASGLFAAEAENDGVKYGASINLIGNNFAIAVAANEDDAAVIKYVAVGTFEIEAGMVTKIKFTTTNLFADATMQNEITDIPAELQSFSLPIAESGISGELLFDLEDTAVIAFEFKKV